MKLLSAIMRSFLGLSLAVTLATTPVVPAAVAQNEASQFSERIGFLNCTVPRGFALVFGRTRALDCVYSGLGGELIESYSARITEYGIDIGYRPNGVIVWGVFAPSRDNAALGSLAGTYDGIGNIAALGIGVSGTTMVGGLENNIALQPFTIEGANGFNIAGGIVSLRLERANLQI